MPTPRTTASPFAIVESVCPFYLIGRQGDKKAAEYAKLHDGVTLETTIDTKGIELPVWNPTDPNSVAAWRQISHDYAAGAKGHVRVLQGEEMRINPVWGEVEFPDLKANPNVKSIRSIDITTGKEVLLWER